MQDVIIIGGSYSGLSAALQLARARRRVTVVDAGKRRNRFAEHSHGFLGQDGRAPGDIVADAKRQLLAYPTAEWVDGTANTAVRQDDGFAVTLEGGRRIEASRIVLAGGVTDSLPDVPGISERWGRSVFHCPYCHGYELDRGRIGVLASVPQAMHQALLVSEWGEATLFLNGAFEPEPHELDALRERGVALERAAVERLEETATVHLADGRRLAFDGLFATPRSRPSSDLHEQLGCAVVDGPLGPSIRTDERKRTSVPGVFACGDAARMSGSIALAVGDGAMAGAATHQSLVFGMDDWETG